MALTWSFHLRDWLIWTPKSLKTLTRLISTSETLSLSGKLQLQFITQTPSRQIYQDDTLARRRARKLVAAYFRRDLFCRMKSSNHCLPTLLPPDRTLNQVLRTRGHSFQLPTCSFNLQKQSFVISRLFKFLTWVCSCFVCVLFSCLNWFFTTRRVCIVRTMPWQ